ncbi:hypothetical protein WME75_16195 [Sorangium sp. So ce1014]|uniref:hypothetical protein n=1 Tax=Sorangium sp. So ce1014 TaxID=3133326 RepID=UPI003F5EE416
MLPRALAGAAILLSLAASPGAARASACCGTGHGIAQWLAPSERAAASFSLRFAEQLGAWTPERDFDALGEGVYHRELRADVGWMVRIEERLQLGISLPLRHTWIGAGLEGTFSGGDVGDVSAAGRIALIEGAMSPWIPSAAFTLGVTLPTGYGEDPVFEPTGASASGADAGGTSAIDLGANGADTTDLGVAEFRPGIVFEKSWGSVQALLAASISVRTAYHAAGGEEVQPADRVQVVAAAGPVWASGTSLSVGGLYEREGSPRVVSSRPGRRGGERERTALLAVLAHDVGARWTAVGNLQVDVPISGIGRSEGAFAALSAGLRYVWGRHD